MSLAKSASREEASEQSPFWRFSLRFYRRPAVADACIALQEQSGVDVNLLLFALWHASHGHALSADELRGLEQRIAPWRETTIVPLRAIRRALKSPPDLLAPAEAEVFRTKVKALELEAERLQQQAMYDRAKVSLMGRKMANPEAAAQAGIRAYEAICQKAPFPPQPTATLLAAFRELVPSKQETENG